MTAFLSLWWQQVLMVLCIATIGTAATAQSTLIADNVTITGDSLLVAEGNVEIFEGDKRLLAHRVTYDRTLDRFVIAGPIRLQDGEGTVILASQADIAPDLQSGILRGARMVLENQMQVTSVELQQVDARYNQGFRVAATACRVCEGGAPIWQIRARRIVHDKEEKQLYFDNAQVRIVGVPVLWLPRLRLPDPSLKRASGFLTPTQRHTTRLGTGVKIPYFITLGDHADLRLTAYLSHRTRTLETRWRRAYRRGQMQWDLSVSRDDLVPDRIRWSIFGEGAFDIGSGFDLRFDIEHTPDRDYLLDYGISGKDRLESDVFIQRVRRHEYFRSGLTFFKTLRESEDNATQPTTLVDVVYDRRFSPAFLGGEAVLGFDSHYRQRQSTSELDADGDGLSDGLDVARTSVSAKWHRQWFSPTGLVVGTDAAIGGDVYGIRQDLDDPRDVVRGHAAAGIAVSYPLQAKASTGTVHLLEPKVQLVWSDVYGDEIPNEDATRVEFDEGNLFSLNRSPGFDSDEVGRRANIGLTWSRIGTEGWNSSMTIGRVSRFSGENDFTVSSGLRDGDSDWLISGSLETPNGIELIGRALLQDDLATSKNEIRLNWRRGPLSTRSAFAFLRADPAENRPDAVSELRVDADYRLNSFVKLDGRWRYDFNAEATSSASAGVSYENECLEFRLSLSRRFATSDTVDASTEFQWTVGLRGYGNKTSDLREKRSCSAHTIRPL